MGEWTYEGETGCANWGKIGYPIVDKGNKQSPINIVTADCVATKASEVSLKAVDVGSCSCKIMNTGYTTKVEFDEKTKHIEVQGEAYGLVQFHFHSPSEHTVDGDFYPLTLHLVHESMTNPGKLCVIGVLFQPSEGEGAGNPFLEQVFSSIPKEKGGLETLSGGVTFEGLNFDGSFWNYPGGLTTPPCTECVNWIVLQDIHTTTPEQLKVYMDLFPMETNRPVQPLHARFVRSVNV